MFSQSYTAGMSPALQGTPLVLVCPLLGDRQEKLWLSPDVSYSCLHFPIHITNTGSSRPMFHTQGQSLGAWASSTLPQLLSLEQQGPEQQSRVRSCRSVARAEV